MKDTSDKKNNPPKHTIAFYNVENLFDIYDDPDTLDDDFTPDAEKRWNKSRFKKKIKKTGRAIRNIGFSEINKSPTLIGLAEIENAYVLDELIASDALKEKGYAYVHYDSPDERGIDTALLYKESYFSVIESKSHTLYLTTEEGNRDYTRDILHVTGELEGRLVHILVNHWPSRRKGTEETEHKRISAAQKNIQIIESIQKQDENARIIIMGDFNDDPHSKSIKSIVSKGFYNPMEMLLTKYQGSLNYRDNWNLFDQILMTYNFLQQHSNDFRFFTAKIYNPTELQEYKGKYKGNPFRTYVGKKYLGGYSDHFPVYTVFTMN